MAANLYDEFKEYDIVDMLGETRNTENVGFGAILQRYRCPGYAS
jgi:hypothetical protein